MVAFLSIALFVLQASCTSTTVINSSPSGAKIYIDGSLMGKTPYTHSDTKIVGATTMVTLKKEGCENFNGIISRSEKFEVGPCIGGAFVLVPFLWVMGYNPMRTFELECNMTTNLSSEERNLVFQIKKEEAKVQCRYSI